MGRSWLHELGIAFGTWPADRRQVMGKVGLAMVMVNVNLLPAWWHEHYGLSFGERYYKDPECRIEADRFMKRTLHERFGDLGLGMSRPDPVPVVDGYCVATLPALFGASVVFSDSAYPAAIDTNLPDDEADALEVPGDILSRSPLDEIVQQADFLKARYGRVIVGINWQGVLNLALKIRGQNLFFDFYDNPDRADRLLAIAQATIIKTIRSLEEHYGRPEADAVSRVRSYRSCQQSCRTSESIGASFNPLLMASPMNTGNGTCYITANCTLPMISPTLYDRFVLKYDILLAQELQEFGIHHCGKIDRYLPSYTRIPHIKRLEAGFDSDVRQVRQYFPETWLIARLSPAKFPHMDQRQIEEEVERLIEAGSPSEKLCIEVTGLGPETPDENVRSLYHAVRH